MIDGPPPPHPEPGDADVAWFDGGSAPIPDSVDLVVEAAAMESVFAAQRLQRVHAMRRELLEDAVGRGAGVTEIVERSIRLELAAAMRVTEYAAGRMIAHAEALVHRYPEALDSLGGARMTARHAEILVDLVDQIPAELRAGVAARAVELAESEPVGTFRRALRALVETAQATTLPERYRAEVETRRVAMELGADGMALLLAYAPAVEVQGIFGRITAMAKTITGREDEKRTLDQVRADVLTDLLMDGVTASVPREARGIRASVVVTVPVLSLLTDNAESADPPVVEGLGPISLDRARELCGGDASWMRVLTHPETGMVLSVGREQYRPPPSLRKLTKWRSDRCMGPGCGMPASRCEIDHQLAWEHGGSTSLANTAPLCKGHHIVKHHGGWRVTQIEGSGGSIEWISPTGRRYVVHPERRVPVFRASAASGAPPPF